jgi:hypothetical protein
LKEHEGDENGRKWVRVWQRTGHEEEDNLRTKDIEVVA